LRLTAVSRAAGLVLARDLPPVGEAHIPMLRAGVVLTARMADAVARKGIYAVWVEDELSVGIEPTELLPAHVRAETAGSVREALTLARTSFANDQPLPPAVVSDLSHVVSSIAAHITDTPDAALALTDLAGADQYTHQHSINVTALGLVLGREMFKRDGWTDFRGARRFDGVDRQLITLGMGLLLHDIGKMAVPSEVLLKPGALDADEWEIMKTHPAAGVALLRSNAISPMVKSTVRDHHERWDGTGYQRGISDLRISQHARIAAVADVYDAMTSERTYKRAAPAHEAVRVIVDGAGTAFDPEIVAVFRRIVLPYQVGTEVTLPDGRVGVVASVDRGQPEIPLVRVAGPAGFEDVPVDLRTASGA
jgi:HD-GYP domain-containing protein (c-di-GMP phosphodiesterase class II)